MDSYHAKDEEKAVQQGEGEHAIVGHMGFGDIDSGKDYIERFDGFLQLGRGDGEVVGTLGSGDLFVKMDVGMYYDGEVGQCKLRFAEALEATSEKHDVVVQRVVDESEVAGPMGSGDVCVDKGLIGLAVLGIVSRLRLERGIGGEAVD